MRTDLDTLPYAYSNPFEVLDIFERKLADFFHAPYCVLVDSCTHGIELCLRTTWDWSHEMSIPLQTYMSIPMMLAKLNISYAFNNQPWSRYYKLEPTTIYDAATLWERDSYIHGTMMVLSFQHKKHIKIGRGGAILLDDKDICQRLKKLRYDGRNLLVNHADDDIDEIGYHYYMTPEDAALGIKLFDQHADAPARSWSNNDYRQLNTYKVFNHIKVK